MYSPGSSNSSVAVGDLNGDGLPDIAIARASRTNDPVYYGDVLIRFQDILNPGSFSPPVEYAVDPGIKTVVIGDINNDGLSDLVTANSLGPSISLLMQDPANPGTFLSVQNLPAGKGASGVAVGDLNGDGFADLAVADVELSIFLQDPALPGTFQPRTSLGVDSTSVAIEDLDGDLLPDLVVTDSQGIQVILQDTVTPGTFLPAVEYLVGGEDLTDVVIGDLNNDNLTDLALGLNNDKSKLLVFLQDPSKPGSFLPATTYIMGDYVYEVAIGDLNDDDRLDLAISGWIVSGGKNYKVKFKEYVWVLLQDPAMPGAFFPPVRYGVDDFAGSLLAIADLNEDSFNDVLVGAKKIAIMFQDLANPGSFLPVVVVD